MPKIKRARILFLLAENIHEVLTTPWPWQTGHLAQMDDLILDKERGNNRFVIADSLHRKILGPFIQTKPQVYHEKGLTYQRKEPRTNETYPVTCHWIIEFKPAGIAKPRIIDGIGWTHLARILGLEQISWAKIRSLELTDLQFDRLCGELSIFNDNPEKYLEYYPDGAYVEFEDYGYDSGPGDTDEGDESYAGILRDFGLNDEQIEVYAESDDRD